MKSNHRKKEIATILSVIALFGLSALAVSRHGAANRVYSDPGKVKIIAEQREAVDVWEDAGVRGRILVLAARYLNAEGPWPIPLEIPVAGNDNFVYVALRKNIIRKVYHVIPEHAWPEVVENISRARFVTGAGTGFRIVEWDIPVLIMRGKDLPPIREKVLLHINGDYRDEGDIRRIIGLLQDRTVSSDLITISGNFPGNGLAGIRDYVDQSNR